MASYMIVSSRRMKLLTDKPHIYKEGGKWHINRVQWGFFGPTKSGLHRYHMNGKATNFCYRMNQKEGN